MTDFNFDDVGTGGSRYGNSQMDNLLAGDQIENIPRQQQGPPKTSQNAQNRREQQQQQNAQAERQYQQRQQQSLVDVTQQNTLANSKNLGYDPQEYMVLEDNQLSSVNDVNLFVRIMLGLILFFQIFIIFRLFANQNSN